MEHMFWRARVARMRGHSGHSNTLDTVDQVDGVDTEGWSARMPAEPCRMSHGQAASAAMAGAAMFTSSTRSISPAGCQAFFACTAATHAGIELFDKWLRRHSQHTPCRSQSVYVQGQCSSFFSLFTQSAMVVVLLLMVVPGTRSNFGRFRIACAGEMFKAKTRKTTWRRDMYCETPAVHIYAIFSAGAMPLSQSVAF